MVGIESNTTDVEGWMQSLFSDYASGDITLQGLLELAVAVLQATEPDGRHRDELLGRLMRNAAATKPDRRGRGPRGLPPSIRDVVRQLAPLIAEREGWARSSSQTVDRIIEMFSELRGVTLTPDQVKEFCRPRPRPRRRR